MPADTQQLTPWFDGSVKPVRAGVYEREAYWGKDFSLWNGSHWMAGASSPMNAIEFGAAESLLQPFFREPVFQWRGLKEPSK